MSKTFLSLKAIVNALACLPLSTKTFTVIIGEPGMAKTATLPMVAKLLPKHKPVYIDVPWLDVGDLSMVVPDEQRSKLVRILGEAIPMDIPIVLLLDEVWKAQAFMRPVLTTLYQERRIGNHFLHPDSVIYGTSNGINDGVGDKVHAHELNRSSVIYAAKATSEEYQAHARDNHGHEAVLTWCDNTPEAFAYHLTAPRDREGRVINNPYVFDPRGNNQHFVSLRSLSKASEIMWASDAIGFDATRAYLEGTVGEAAAKGILSVAKIGKDVPRVEAVIADPTGLPPITNNAHLLFFFNRVFTSGKVQTMSDMDAVCEFIERSQCREMFAVFYSMATGTNSTAALAARSTRLRKFGGNNVELI